MSEEKAKPVMRHEPRRDQSMPQYAYPATSTEHRTLTMRSTGSGPESQRMVLVNGQAAY